MYRRRRRRRRRLLQQHLLDGLVLGFVSSLNSSRIHCFDYTVRCNPSKISSSAATEELDGWRGYWTPFTPTVVRQQQQQPPPTCQHCYHQW